MRRNLHPNGIKGIIEDKHYDAGIRISDMAPVAVSSSGIVPKFQAQFLTQLLTGIFGADRIDYLLRDSLHTGVSYGRFDSHRLIQSLNFNVDEETGNPELVLERGGIHAAEGLILARYFMFQQVYYHHTRRMYDHHLIRGLGEVLPNGRFPDNMQEYLLWDDTTVEAAFQTSQSDDARRIVQRDHFRRAFQAPDGDLERYVDRKEDLQNALDAEFGPQKAFVDAEIKPLVKPKEMDFSFVDDEGHKSDWQTESRVLKTLPVVGFMRVYSGENREGVARFVDRFFA